MSYWLLQKIHLITKNPSLACHSFWFCEAKIRVVILLGLIFSDKTGSRMVSCWLFFSFFTTSDAVQLPSFSKLINHFPAVCFKKSKIFGQPSSQFAGEGGNAAISCLCEAENRCYLRLLRDDSSHFYNAHSLEPIKGKISAKNMRYKIMQNSPI